MRADRTVYMTAHLMANPSHLRNNATTFLNFTLTDSCTTHLSWSWIRVPKYIDRAAWHAHVRSINCWLTTCRLVQSRAYFVDCKGIFHPHTSYLGTRKIPFFYKSFLRACWGLKKDPFSAKYITRVRPPLYLSAHRWALSYALWYMSSLHMSTNSSFTHEVMK